MRHFARSRRCWIPSGGGSRGRWRRRTEGIGAADRREFSQIFWIEEKERRMLGVKMSAFFGHQGGSGAPSRDVRKASPKATLHSSWSVIERVRVHSTEHKWPPYAARLNPSRDGAPDPPSFPNLSSSSQKNLRKSAPIYGSPPQSFHGTDSAMHKKRTVQTDPDRAWSLQHHRWAVMNPYR